MLPAARLLPKRHHGPEAAVSPPVLLPVSDADSTSPLPPDSPSGRPC